mmetsp:Transcript_31856/g.69705  ORF Transcript_31856/g.69705 Transcript_31856/m.69705 type:complete len:203 (-) Transcript_31856:176-784(-)
MFARTDDQMPSAPMRTSPRSVSPSSRTTETPPRSSWLYEATAAELRTEVCTRSRSTFCRSGRSMTHVKGICRASAGVLRSNFAYHSSRIPSLMPLVRLPVHVASDSIVWYIPGSISRKERIALDASWIGPPKRLNSLVRSSTVKCTGVPFSACAARQFARARPPTPAPEMITWSGFVSSIASARGPDSSTITASCAVATATG